MFCDQVERCNQREITSEILGNQDIVLKNGNFGNQVELRNQQVKIVFVAARVTKMIRFGVDALNRTYKHRTQREGEEGESDASRFYIVLCSIEDTFCLKVFFSTQKFTKYVWRLFSPRGEEGKKQSAA